MATGSTDATLATGTSGELAEVLAGEETVTVVATPAVRQVVAAAALAAFATAPVHVRVVGPDRPAMSAPTVATTPGLAAAAIELSPYEPLADVQTVVDGGALPPAVETAIAAIRGAGSDAAPGVVATHPDLAASVERSARFDPPGAALPVTGAVAALTPDGGRTLASWLVAAALAEGRPRGAADALERALGPSPHDGDPAPTAEGVLDLLVTAVETAPGTALATLLGDHGWAPVIDAYETAVEAAQSAVDELPDGADAEVPVAELGDAPATATARRWSSARLEGPYGALIAGEAPATITLVATGERSASAVLETVANRHDGACWGGTHVAGAILPERPGDPARAITKAL